MKRFFISILLLCSFSILSQGQDVRVIRRAMEEAIAKQKAAEAKNQSSTSSSEQREQREAQAAAERARREEAQRREEARIKAAGDAYIQQSAPKYNQMRQNAQWEATVGKQIVGEKTAMENFFTPGTRIIERDAAGFDYQPANTSTDKSELLSKLKQRRASKGETVLSSDMVFVPINARANDYLKDVVQSNYRPAYLQFDYFLRLDRQYVKPSFGSKVDNFLDRTEEWAQARLDDGRSAIVYGSVSFCSSVAKNTISRIGSMSKQVMNVYEILMDVGTVKDVELGMINNALDFIKNNWDSKDYWERAEHFNTRQEDVGKMFAKDLIDGVNNEGIGPWFIRVAKN